MNLVKYYFIGVLVAIGALAASAFWQYQQFQNSVKNLTFAVPPQISSGMPNFNDQFAQMMKQAQSSQNQPAPQNQNTVPIETKEFKTSDELLKFNYPADWQEANNQQIEDVDGKIIFYATKIAGQELTPTMNFLIVKQPNAKTETEIIDKLKKDAQTKGIAVKFTQSEIINGNQTIPVVELRYGTAEPITGTSVNSATETAIVTANNRIYTITAMSQGSNINISQESEKIFSTIKINKGNETK